jgi:hypothetical protein
MPSYVLWGDPSATNYHPQEEVALKSKKWRSGCRVTCKTLHNLPVNERITTKFIGLEFSKGFLN